MAYYGRNRRGILRDFDHGDLITTPFLQIYERKVTFIEIKLK